MPLRITVLALAASCATLCAAAAEHPPYVGYINADEVYARSGPGKNYYPTEKLARGTEVEVYRHDPGGWFAIRPPEGSFSWVSGEFLKPTEENLAITGGDRVVVRVGSQFSDIRDVIQVRLNRGEEVEVVEAKRFNAGPAAQTWYKIAPPAGEFRWVHGKFVDREPPQNQRKPEGPRRNLLVDDDEPPGDDLDEAGDDTALDDEAELADYDGADEHSADERDADYDEAGEAALTSGTSEELDERDEEPARERRSARKKRAVRSAKLARDDDAVEDPDADHEDRPAQVADARAARRRPKRPANDGDEGATPIDEMALRRELRAVDLTLSAMVADEPDKWELDGLRARAEHALAVSETAIERGRARLLLGKIERFADIRRRWDTLANATASRRRVDGTFLSAALPGAPTSQFDGVGRLARVRSEIAGTPGYALTDAAGTVRYYITPAPGVNLGHYLGREVGVSGVVGFVPELNQQQVTAQRVTVLADQTLRR